MTMTDVDVWRCLSYEDNPGCTLDSPCFACADGLHAAALAAGLCDDDCRQCKYASIQTSPIVGMDSRGRKFGQLGWKDNNSWERGVPTDHCGMPFLDENGVVMGAKKVAENRQQIDASMRHWAAVKAATSTGSN